MTTDTDLIAYLEAQRKRRTKVLGIVLVALIAIGGIAFAVKTAADADRRAECEVNEYLGGDEC